MKGIKITRLFTVCISSSLLFALVPFYVATAGSSISFNLFNFKDMFYLEYSLMEKVTNNNLLDHYLYQISIIGSFTSGIVLAFTYVLSLVKNKKASQVFSSFSAITILFALFCTLLKGVYLGGALSSENLLIFLSISSVLILEFVLNVAELTSISIIKKIELLKNVAPSVQYNQQVSQSLNTSQQTTGVSISAPELADSIEIKRHIENLKSGLNMPSYDEALEVIESTGEWQGLNMKDVQEYNYEDEIIKNEMKFNRLNGTEKFSTIVAKD